MHNTRARLTACILMADFEESAGNAAGKACKAKAIVHMRPSGATCSLTGQPKGLACICTRLNLCSSMMPGSATCVLRIDLTCNGYSPKICVLDHCSCIDLTCIRIWYLDLCSDTRPPSATCGGLRCVRICRLDLSSRIDICTRFRICR